MTETPPTRVDDRLDDDRRSAIVELMLGGRAISEVTAHGLTRRPGWRRQHVVDVVAANGWTLDSDGRVPKTHRRSVIVPMTALPGGPVPTTRPPVAEWPERGTITEGPRAVSSSGITAPRGVTVGDVPPAQRPPTPIRATSNTGGLQVPGVPAAAMVAAGKAHETAKIRRLAERAEKALDELAEALAADSEDAKIRARLAQLEAEADRLRAQLGQKRKKPTDAKVPAAAAPSTAPAGEPLLPPGTSEANGGKPINHGGWGGYQQHRNRGEEACAQCDRGMNEHMDRMRAKSPKSNPAVRVDA